MLLWKSGSAGILHPIPSLRSPSEYITVQTILCASSPWLDYFLLNPQRGKRSWYKKAIKFKPYYFEVKSTLGSGDGGKKVSFFKSVDDRIKKT